MPHDSCCNDVVLLLHQVYTRHHRVEEWRQNKSYPISEAIKGNSDEEIQNFSIDGVVRNNNSQWLSNSLVGTVMKETCFQFLVCAKFGESATVRWLGLVGR